MGNGEVPVALILAGHGHDGPRPVGHEHVVGQEDWNGLAGERVHDPAAGSHAALVQRTLGGESVDLGAAGHRGPKGVDFGPLVVSS